MYRTARSFDSRAFDAGRDSVRLAVCAAIGSLRMREREAEKKWKNGNYLAEWRSHASPASLSGRNESLSAKSHRTYTIPTPRRLVRQVKEFVWVVRQKLIHPSGKPTGVLENPIGVEPLAIKLALCRASRQGSCSRRLNSYENRHFGAHRNW